MQAGESGLQSLQRLPVAVRAEDHKIEVMNGEDMATVMNRWLIGIFGDINTGKSFSMFSMLEDHVELRASDDDWIRTVFAHDPNTVKKLLTKNEKIRRTWLRSAHKIIFLDFDTLGAQPLFQSMTCNSELFKCIEYIPCRNWEDAFKAMEYGQKVFAEHSEKWGKVGCWFIVDNMNKSWSFVQGDWIHSLTGTDLNTLMADIRLNNPGRDSAARTVQADKINEMKDWAVINPAYNDEWVNVMVWSGFNVMFLSPPKEFEVIIGEMGGKPVKEKIFNLGGAKDNRFAMNYIWRKYVSKDGHTFYADLVKTRFTGIKGNEISNPTWRRMRTEMERIENDQLSAKRIRHKQFDYYDDLPNLDDLPDIEVAPTIIPATVEQSMDTIVPSVESIDDLDFPGLSALDDIDISMEDDLEEDDLDIDIEEDDLDIDVGITSKRISSSELKNHILAFIKHTNTNNISSISDHIEEEWDVTADRVDDIITELLDEKILYEPSLGMVAHYDDPEPFPAQEPNDTPEPKPIQETAPDSPEEEIWIVSAKDRGKGNYHKSDCGVVKRIKKQLEVTDPEGRNPCPKCIKVEESEPESKHEIEDEDDEIDIEGF